MLYLRLYLWSDSACVYRLHSMLVPGPACRARPVLYTIRKLILFRSPTVTNLELTYHDSDR